MLQRDPATAYGRMDFLSRDRYRQAVEDLADGSGEGELRMALRVVESARLADENGLSGPPVHVGYHLIGKGRADLEADVAYRPSLRHGRNQLNPKPTMNRSCAGANHSAMTSAIFANTRAGWPASLNFMLAMVAEERNRALSR